MGAVTLKPLVSDMAYLLKVFHEHSYLCGSFIVSLQFGITYILYRGVFSSIYHL